MLSSLLQPVIRFVDRDEIELVLPWEIETRIGKLRVLSGARSDGASVPDVIDGLEGFHRLEGDTLPAAFAHDMLYAAELCDRETADQILHDLLIASGISALRAAIYRDAVRIGGGYVWTKHTPESIAAARRMAAILPKEVLS